jgi:hypothetical protein
VARSDHPVAKRIAQILRFPLDYCQLRLLHFQKDAHTVRTIAAVRRENEMPAWSAEAFQVMACARAAGRLAGDFAEVGVFRGASAKLIAEVKGARRLHLFDTFEGLPKPEAIDTEHKEREYACDLDFVRGYLSRYPNIVFHKGLFPASAAQMGDTTFSFVHLDVDLYRSTLDCLGFFYPRMVKGGIVLSHDYSTTPGVRKAFDEFYEGKAEPVIEVSTSQVLSVRL